MPPSPATPFDPADDELELPPLPPRVRLVLLVVGSFLVGLGLVGLFLPVLQGVLFLAIGAALLSLASDWVHRTVSRALQRWPSLHERMHRFRRHWHARLQPRPRP
jgi:uncharacterized membrane protein YbaN (DUF454 family)